MSNWKNRLVVAGAFAGFLTSTSMASALSTDIQFFPPVVPGSATQVCGPSPSGYTYALVWDGVTNVQCAQVPISCPSGEGLIYDGANFICSIPCMPTLNTITNGPSDCPAGQVGSVESVTQQKLVFCDGTIQTLPSSPPTNTCAPPPPQVVQITAISSITCTKGQTVTGSYVTVNGQQVFDPSAGGSITCP